MLLLGSSYHAVNILGLRWRPPCLIREPIDLIFTTAICQGLGRGVVDVLARILKLRKEAQMERAKDQ